uniref:(California timema) hypothetical protein n=1 Tax=Timema californicum TaxID=61474 RepID=A0A7R9JHV0_TIMCA|nr:unnamed protein product [Timema californicum]
MVGKHTARVLLGLVVIQPKRSIRLAISQVSKQPLTIPWFTRSLLPLVSSLSGVGVAGWGGARRGTCKQSKRPTRSKSEKLFFNSPSVHPTGVRAPISPFNAGVAPRNARPPNKTPQCCYLSRGGGRGQKGQAQASPGAKHLHRDPGHTRVSQSHTLAVTV